MGALREKNHYTEEWSVEVLRQAIKEGRRTANVVIDLFAGWQSLKPVCEELGLTYIGVDLMGDRNQFIRMPQRVEAYNCGEDTCFHGIYCHDQCASNADH